MNDFQRLKDEADIAQVVESLGIPVTRKGANNFIACPLPDHDDSHATNCYYKDGWNNVYCEVCKKAIKAPDLIMYETGMSYGEAMDYLWELSGCPDWYYEDRTPGRKKKFSLTGKEASLIGISVHGTAFLPMRYTSGYREYLSSEMPKGTVYKYDGEDGYLLCKKQSVNIADFFDEQGLVRLVLNKCKELIEFASGKDRDALQALSQKASSFLTT